MEIREDWETGRSYLAMKTAVAACALEQFQRDVALSERIASIGSGRREQLIDATNYSHWARLSLSFNTYRSVFGTRGSFVCMNVQTRYHDACQDDFSLGRALRFPRRRRIVNYVAILPLVATLATGCGVSYDANDGGHFLDVFFFETFETNEKYDSVSLITVVLQNAADSSCRIVGVEFRNADTKERIGSTILKKSGGDTIKRKSMEHLIVQLDESNNAPMVVRVDFEQGGRKWHSSSLQNPKETRPGRVFPHKDLASLSMYVDSGAVLNIDELQCTVNGKEMKISGVTSVPVSNEQFASVAEIKLDDSFSAGDRLFVKLRANRQPVWCATTKLFFQFSVGTTQYDQVIRPVLVQHNSDYVKLQLYNEADYRKSPALLQKVILHGEDVTDRAVLPAGALPPDLHNYDEDVRDVVVGVASNELADRHKFKIQFQRLSPLRPEKTPDGYFAPQSFSFETHLNVPFAIGSEEGWGVPGAACVFQGGLRPRPELSELIQRFTDVYNGSPSIPAYVCASSGTRLEHLQRMAACGDFLVAGEPIIAQQERDALNRSDQYFRSLEQLEAIPGTWIASVLSENEPNWTSPTDLKWQAWACVASGSHGLWLTPPHKGNEKMIADCTQATQEVRHDVGELEPLSGISISIALPVNCNQEGLRIKSLLCGCDNLLVFVFNEWSSRSAYQGDEPFNAAMRQDAELQLTLPAQWEHISVVDPLTGLPVAFEADENGRVTVKLPQFNNVQLLRVSRSNKPVELTIREQKEDQRSFIFESTPVIDLGMIRPNSEHVAEFRIRSLRDVTLRFKATKVSHGNSMSGEFSVGSNNEFELGPGETTTVAIAYTAAGTIGDSVTNIHFQDGNESFNTYLVASIQEPAELLPSIVDFGLVAVGLKSEPKTIAVKSIERKFRIGAIAPSSATVVDIKPTENGSTLSFCVLPATSGTFSAEVHIEVFVGNDSEPLRRALTIHGEARESVFASPSTVSQVVRNKPFEYSILVGHVAGQILEISSVEGGSSVTADWPQGKLAKEHTITLTIAPEIISETEPRLTIKGKSISGSAFTIKVPIKVIALAQQTRGSE